VTLEQIRSKTVDPDAENEDDDPGDWADHDFLVVRISFLFRGRQVALEMPFGELLEPVRAAVNRILAEEGEPRRFFHVPAPDRRVGYVFVPPDVYDAATKVGILPAEFTLDV
jgi:hypothetical protein